MFSMFFRAGNVVFPLAIGQYAQNQNIYAILKLLITAVGPHVSIVAAVAVALACLTTAIALAAVFVEHVHKELLTQEIPYSLALVSTLIISCIVASFNFTGILTILAPILEVCYLSLIVLCLVNSAHKLFYFQW